VRSENYHAQIWFRNNNWEIQNLHMARTCSFKIAEPCLQQEHAESKLEIQRLRESLSLGTPTVHKDMSLIFLIPKWPESETADPLEEFISSLEAAARVGRWQESDTLEVALLKITDSAKLFYNGCPELHTKDTTWQAFKSAFRERFKDARTAQYHFTNLQSARQRKNESPQEFADRCRALAQKIVRKVDDHLPRRSTRKMQTVCS
jgi:hypothetical protein